MELYELIALLEAKIKLKNEELDANERKNKVERSQFLNHIRGLEVVLNTLNLKGK